MVDGRWQGAYTAGIGQEVRADGLDLAVVGLAEGADGLEVLLAGPALGQDGQRQVDLDVGHGCGRCDRCGAVSVVGRILFSTQAKLP